MPKYLPLFIVDHPFEAKAYQLLLHRHGIDARVLPLQPPDTLSLPPSPVLLVEPHLPEYTCGLLWAHRLQKHQPDVHIIHWTHHPAPFLLWTGYRWGNLAFLDKSQSPQNLLAALYGILSSSNTWPSLLFERALQWEKKVGVRLMQLSRDHWMIWEGGLRGKNMKELGRQLALSEGTIRRKRKELFQILGVQGWSEAVSLAYKWGLIEVYQRKPLFRPLVWEIFAQENA